MGGHGTCCRESDCSSLCEAYIPATSWPIQVFGQLIYLTQHPTNKCSYQAEACWLSDFVEEASWSLSYGWEDGDPGWDTLPGSGGCTSGCDGLVYDFPQVQTHYRASVKRFSQVRYSVFVVVSPVTTSGTLLKVTVVYEYRKRYFHGASQTARSRYRLSEGTCPAGPVAGTWVSSSAPSMPSVDKPSFFDDCFGGLNNSFATCPFELGSVVSPTTWGTFNVSYRRLSTSGTCAIVSTNLAVPDDIAVRKSTGLPPSPSSWVPCDDILFPAHQACDSNVFRTRTYVSDEFECSAIPPDIVCESGLSTIADASSSVTCGPQTFTNVTPGLLDNITVDLIL